MEVSVETRTCVVCVLMLCVFLPIVNTIFNNRYLSLSMFFITSGTELSAVAGIEGNRKCSHIGPRCLCLLGSRDIHTTVPHFRQDRHMVSRVAGHSRGGSSLLHHLMLYLMDSHRQQLQYGALSAHCICNHEPT